MQLALESGHQVAGLAVPGTPRPLLTNAPDAVWLSGTLAEAPWAEIADFRPEACVNAAWVATPGTYWESPLNHDFVRWSRDFILRACEHGVRQVVSVGSCSEYGMGGRLSEATTPLEPTTTYARCKNELRLLLDDDARQRGFRHCWARVFYPYGIGEHRDRLCSSIAYRLLADQPVTLKTPASTKDYIYIDDLAKAFLVLLEKECVGPVNLGTGTGVAVREIASTIGRLLNKPQLIVEAESPGSDPLSNVLADASRLHSLGWRPTTTLPEGLQRLIHHLQP